MQIRKPLWQKTMVVAIYTFFSAFTMFLVGALLRSGFEYIGDGEILVFRDGLLPFLIALSAIYILTLIVCVSSIRLPYYDYIGRIIVVNLFVYGLFGLALSLLKIPLYSRTLIVSEFVLSTVFILYYYFLRNRFFPTKIGLLSNTMPSNLVDMRLVKWVLIDRAQNRLPQIDGVVVDLHEALDQNMMRFIADLGQNGISVYDKKHTETLLTGRLRLDYLSIGEFDNFTPLGLYAPIKRSLDIVITVLLLPFTILLGIVIALVIMIYSSGPVFFQQERVGYLGKPFSMFKFRTMHSQDVNPLTRFAEENDSRITKVGRLLRRTRLDELPQFWNVLKGDMSIIGPRPEQQVFAERFTEAIPFYGFRHTVKPGITGWAQVKSGYAADENQTRIKLEYDFFYIKYLSLWLEIIILVRTIGTIVFGKGAR